MFYFVLMQLYKWMRTTLSLILHIFYRFWSLISYWLCIISFVYLSNWSWNFLRWLMSDGSNVSCLQRISWLSLVWITQSFHQAGLMRTLLESYNKINIYPKDTWSQNTSTTAAYYTFSINVFHMYQTLPRFY